MMTKVCLTSQELETIAERGYTNAVAGWPHAALAAHDDQAWTRTTELMREHWRKAVLSIATAMVSLGWQFVPPGGQT